MSHRVCARKDCSKSFYSEYDHQKYCSHVCRETANSRIHRAKNRDKINAEKKNYYWLNRESLIGKSKEYHKKNPEARSEASKYWALRNKDKISALKARRRASERDAIGFLSNKDWEDIIKEWGYACMYCGKNDAPLTKDHWIPLIKGGPHTKDNIVPACRNCNSQKSSMWPVEFLSRRRTRLTDEWNASMADEYKPADVPSRYDYPD